MTAVRFRCEKGCGELFVPCSEGFFEKSSVIGGIIPAGALLVPCSVSWTTKG